ncbi:MAG: L-threonylcarbamoyladenylate synthase [Hyphomicrobiaceae bacterium]
MIIAADTDGIARAARYLAQGGLVAFPTETVYGLGADATNGFAVAGIFAAKGRPAFNPLIIHVPEAAAVRHLAEVTPLAQKLAAAFWPGPMTLVLKALPNGPVEPLALAGLDTIALRVPSHPVALAMLRAARVPVAAPSANRSGHVSPTSAQHVADDLGERVPMVLDGGASDVGLESTIVDATGDVPVLLRPGAITREDIARVTGGAVLTVEDLKRGGAGQDAPTAPGQLESHYAPRARVRLNARDVMPGEALLAFGADVPKHTGPMLNLSHSGDAVEAAANLFGHLRALDRADVMVIAVMPVPYEGLGEAINDRLGRAAAAR